MRSPGAVDSQRRHGHWAGIGCGRSWFLEQAVRWINQPEQDPVYIQASVATCRSLSECWNLTVDVGEAYAAHHLANGPPEPLPAPARMEWTQLPGIGPGTEILGGDLVGLRIVELGCGAGHNTAQLAAFGADAIGVDCPSGQIRRAVSHYRHTGAQFVHGSALMYLTGITGYLRAIVSVLGAIGLTEPPHCWPLPHAGSPRAAPSRSPYPTPQHAGMAAPSNRHPRGYPIDRRATRGRTRPEADLDRRPVRDAGPRLDELLRLASGLAASTARRSAAPPGSWVLTRRVSG